LAKEAEERGYSEDFSKLRKKTKEIILERNYTKKD